MIRTGVAGITKVTAVLAIATGATTMGCNVLIGTEDHEAFPDNCGAASLTTARFSFTDDEAGHCYTLVQTDNEEEGTNFADAKDSCTEAGGMLACIDNAAELELIARNVPTNAWLGMNALREESLETFRCISGRRFAPDYPAWAEGHPTADGGGPCTILSDGMVVSRGCFAGMDNWVCELEPPEPDE